MKWIGWVLFLIMVFVYYKTQVFHAEKMNALHDYLQFLFFHPELYKDNQAKFLKYLDHDVDRKRPDSEIFVQTQRVVESMAGAMQGEIFPLNIARSRGLTFPKAT